MDNQPKIAVLGGGSWATAIVKMLSENLDSIGWYMRDTLCIEHIKENKHNPNYLSSAELHPEKLNLSSNINEVIKNYEVLIFAIPSAYLNDELQKVSASLKDKIIFSAIKGIIPETGLIVGEHFNKNYNVSFENIGVITGPCHAEEIAMERLSYLTIACSDKKKAEFMKDCFKGRYVRVKVSEDIVGTEYASVLKNIYAISAGIARGLGYGDNFQAVLMSNAIREMRRFVESCSNKNQDVNDSAYLGDLLVTGYSLFSRNRTFGNMIGKGYTVKSAMIEMTMVVEGYYAVKEAFKIKTKNEINTPIIDAVYNILYNNKEPKIEFLKLTSNLD